MRHPFDLELSDLESVQFNIFEELTDEEAANVAGGGITITTQAIDEEGGNGNISASIEISSLAFREEGGGATTLAVGEEGGGPQ